MFQDDDPEGFYVKYLEKKGSHHVLQNAYMYM